MKKSNIFEKVRAAFRFFFGSLHYTAPGFILLFGRLIKWMTAPIRRGLKVFKEKHPRIHLSMKILIPLLVIGVFSFLFWLESRPRPQGPSYVYVEVEAPAETPMRPNAEISPLIIEFSRSAAPLRTRKRQYALNQL